MPGALRNGWRAGGLDTALRSYSGSGEGDMYANLTRLALSERPLENEIHAYVQMIWIGSRAAVQRRRVKKRAAPKEFRPM